MTKRPSGSVMKMTHTVKCNHCHIVIDELLAYVQNKVSIADEVTLVQICASAFTGEQIEKANHLLLESLPSDLRKTVRKGKGKGNRLLCDIINVFKVSDPDVIPIFVARDLHKLPPITFDHLDVSKLLKDLMVVQEEIKNIKSTYATIDQLEKHKTECINKKSVERTSPPQSSVNVNLKRGAYRDSGPVGVLELDDTMLSNCMEHSNCETSSPKENTLKYRNIKQIEGRFAAQCNSTISEPATGRCVTSAGGRGSQLGVVGAGNGESTRKTACEASDPFIETEQMPTYASATKVQSTNDGWTVIRKKSSIPKNRLIGKRGNVVVDSEEKFRAADRKIPLFITNVHKNTAEIDIVNYIKNKTNESVSLGKIHIKRQCEHDAYKLFVSHSKLPLYLDVNLWPQGIIFRRFVNFKQRQPFETPEVALKNTNVINE